MEADLSSSKLTRMEYTALLSLACREEFFKRQNEQIRRQGHEALMAFELDTRKIIREQGELSVLINGQKREKIKKFLDEELAVGRELAVINIGAGFDNFDEYAGDSRILFFNLDRTNIVDARKRLGFDGSNAFSMPMEIHQIGELKSKIGARFVVIIMAGVCMYFPVDTLKDIFQRFALKFPHAIVLCDMLSPWGKRAADRVLGPRKLWPSENLSTDEIFRVISKESYAPSILSRHRLGMRQNKPRISMNRQAWTLWLAETFGLSHLYVLRIPGR